MKIEIDLTKSLEENASIYYSKAKKSKKKLKGAKETVMKMREKLLHQANKKEKKKIKIDEKAKKKWYEKFRWFKTTQDLLVIGGKDATTNEEIIKKYTEKNDIVFHTSLAGSPFVVIKKGKQEINEESIKQARIFTATYSKAWENNLKEVEVMKVSPDQVTKEAQAGEYLQKGSFMIYGKRSLKRAPLQLSIGVTNIDGTNKLMGGPHDAIQKHCKKITKIIQGNQRKSEISNKLKKKYKLKKNDEILKILPNGGSTIL